MSKHRIIMAEMFAEGREQSLWKTRSKDQHKEEELLRALLEMHNHACHTPDTPTPLAVRCIK